MLGRVGAIRERNRAGGDGLSGQQLTSVMPCDAYVKNGAWGDRCVQPHGHELLRAAGAVALGENAMLRADLSLQMCR